MLRLAFVFSGVVLIFVGLVVFPMPIPAGAIMIVAGLVLVISASARIAGWVRYLRQRNPGANSIIQAVEDRLPETWKKALRRSDP